MMGASFMLALLDKSATNSPPGIARWDVKVEPRLLAHRASVRTASSDVHLTFSDRLATGYELTCAAGWQSFRDARRAVRTVVQLCVM